MKRSVIIFSGLGVIVLLIGSLFFYSLTTGTVMLKQPDPEVLVANVPTPVKISVIVNGSIAENGVNLLRLEPGGKTTILGQLNPDSSIGENGYSIISNFREPALGGTPTLQVSAVLRYPFRHQVISQSFSLVVSTMPIALPPDPGAAGKATLAGIDSDHDGVRDDIQRYIVFTYPQSQKIRAGLTQVARSMQAMLLGASTQPLAITYSIQENRALDCLFYTMDVSAASNADDQLTSQFLNTWDRSKAYVAINNQLGGQIFPGTPTNQRKAQCTLDPDTMQD